MNTLILDNSQMNKKNTNPPPNYASINNIIYNNVYSKITIPQFVSEMPITELSVQNTRLYSYKVDLTNTSTLKLVKLTLQNFIVFQTEIIANFSGLSSLTLVGTRINDFSFIRHFNLKELTIQLANFSFEEKRIITRQTELQKLALNKCNFRELHLLQELTQLRELSLIGNKLKNEDFIDCRFKYLQQINVSSNQLKSLDNIVDISTQLIGINARLNKIGKLLYKQQQTEYYLEELDISSNKLFDIGALKLFPRLIDLNISHNKLGEKLMRVIQNLPLQSINITNTQVSTMSFINKDTIRHVTFKNNYCCQNLSSFFSWPNLVTFKLFYNNAPLSNKHCKNLLFVKQSQLNLTELYYQNKYMKYQTIQQRYSEKVKKMAKVLRYSMNLFEQQTKELNFLLMLMKTQNGREQQQELNILQYNVLNGKQKIKNQMNKNWLLHNLMQKQQQCLLNIKGAE
ncbi:leucine-rich_repeat domain-containing protein [Hexamita inflata]|uniref:Leucine-rich repeat domain-containing protein n=1 Tax=Hexamita inflata TaxID=28002 RepID=A0AA86N4S9_9EUKA|nr:leucine-rich repeat domain-containing protein [Hexamita inflata]